MLPVLYPSASEIPHHTFLLLSWCLWVGKFKHVAKDSKLKSTYEREYIIFVFLDLVTSFRATDTRFINLYKVFLISFFFYRWIKSRCVYAPQFHYLFIHRWTSRLFSLPGFYEQSSNEHGWEGISRVGCRGPWVYAKQRDSSVTW